MHSDNSIKDRLKIITLSIIILMMFTGCTIKNATPTPLPWIPTVTPEPTDTPEATTITPTVDVPAFDPPTPEASPTPTIVVETPVPSRTPASTSTTRPTQTPSATPQPTQTPKVIPQEITILTPNANAIVDNPIQITGKVAVLPFEGTLVIRIYGSSGQLVAETPIIVQGELGGPGSFEATIAYGGSPGSGRVEVYDFSPKDGSVLASAVVPITLGGFAGGGYFEVPQPQASVTLPLHILARTGIPGQDVNVVLSWVDGTKILQSIKVLQGIDGRGLVMTTLDRNGVNEYPHTQQALVEIIDANGHTLAQQQITLMGPNDPNAMITNVFWVLDESVQVQSVLIPRTLGIGRASLEALLWGPAPNNSAGYSSAIPSPAEVLSYPGRTASWGESVTLKSLSIIEGIAHADFSEELLAHPGGAMRVTLIREQIAKTLQQFSTVNGVSITVDGRDGQLEP